MTQSPANRAGPQNPRPESSPDPGHARAREWMSAYHDRDLPAADAQAFEAHIAACPDCKAEYETMRRAIVEVSGLRSMPVRPRGSLLPSIQRTIRQRSRGKFFADGWSLGAHRYPVLWVALALLLLALLASLWFGTVRDVGVDRGRPPPASDAPSGGRERATEPLPR